jgi:hypothetical protein
MEQQQQQQGTSLVSDPLLGSGCKYVKARAVGTSGTALLARDAKAPRDERPGSYAKTHNPWHLG